MGALPAGGGDVRTRRPRAGGTPLFVLDAKEEARGSSTSVGVRDRLPGEFPQLRAGMK